MSPEFNIDHSQHIIQVIHDGKWLTLHFVNGAWEKLIDSLNNPPDLGVEVSDETQTIDRFG